MVINTIAVTGNDSEVLENDSEVREVFNSKRIAQETSNDRNENSRSSFLEMFCKKGVLRNFTKFAGKHLFQELFFNKVAALGLQLY